MVTKAGVPIWNTYILNLKLMSFLSLSKFIQSRFFKVLLNNNNFLQSILDWKNEIGMLIHLTISHSQIEDDSSSCWKNSNKLYFQWSVFHYTWFPFPCSLAIVSCVNKKIYHRAKLVQILSRNYVTSVANHIKNP